MLEINKIYNEDCLEGMKKVDDKSIDFIFTDPPYNTTNNSWECEMPLMIMWSYQVNIFMKQIYLS